MIVDRMTPRETEVLSLVRMGETNQGIATNLFISEDTVKTHLKSIFSKLQAKTRTEAVYKITLKSDVFRSQPL